MYRKNSALGYYPLSDAEVLSECVFSVGLRGDQPGYINESDLTKKLDEIYLIAFSSPRYLIRDLHIFQVAQMALGDDDRIEGASMSKAKALAILTAYYLRYNNRLDQVPTMIAYREDPSMNIDEMAMLTLNKGLGALAPALPSRDTVILPVTLRQNVVYFITNLRRHFALRSKRIDLLRDYVNEIGFRLQNSLIAPSSLTQFDRSFLTHLLSERYGLTQAEKKGEASGKGEVMAFLNIRPSSRREDRVIMEQIDELKTHILDTDKLSFVKFMTNGIPEDLVIYLGPWQNQLIAGIALKTPAGGFTRLKCIKHDTKLWDASAMMRAVSEQLTPIIVSTQKGTAAMTAPIGPVGNTGKRLLLDESHILTMNMRTDFGPPGTSDFNAVMDSPEFSWTYEPTTTKSGETLGLIRLSYYSKWNRRTLWDVRTMKELLQDRALVTQKLINGAAAVDTGAPVAGMGLMSLDTLDFVDLSLLEGKKKRLVPLKTTVPVQYMRGAAVASKDISLKSYYEQEGDLMVRPAFSEYYRPNLSDFLIPDVVGEERLAQRLGLSYVERERSKIPIMVSNNIWKLKNIFGITIPEKLEKVVRTNIAGLAKGAVLSADDQKVITDIMTR